MEKQAVAFDLKPAAAEDVAFIFGLRLLTMKPVFEDVFGWDDGLEREKAAEALDHTRLVMVDGKPVGVIKLVPGDDEFHLHQMQILPEFQGRGIGTAMVIRAMGETKGKAISLFVVKNTPAHGLYTRLGFERADDYGRYCRMQWRP